MSGETQIEIKSRKVIPPREDSQNPSGSGSRRVLPPSPINSAAYLQNAGINSSEVVKERTEAFLKKRQELSQKSQTRLPRVSKDDSAVNIGATSNENKPVITRSGTTNNLSEKLISSTNSALSGKIRPKYATERGTRKVPPTHVNTIFTVNDTINQNSDTNSNSDSKDQSKPQPQPIKSPIIAQLNSKINNNNETKATKVLSIRALPTVSEKHIENGEKTETKTKIASVRGLPAIPEKHHEVKDSGEKHDTKHKQSKVQTEKSDDTVIVSTKTEEVEDRFERRKGRELDTDYIKKIKSWKREIRKI